MKDLSIGDSVLVWAISEMDYDDLGNRKVYREKRRPFAAKVIGQRRKMLGSCVRGYSGGYFDEPEPSYFQAKGSVLLWEVRHGMMNKPILVDDIDIELTNPVDLPRMGAAK